MTRHALLALTAVLVSATASATASAQAPSPAGPPIPPAAAAAPKPGMATSDADEKGETEHVPWYFPPANERFTPPPKPLPKKSNPPVVSASIDFHSFTSTIKGTATELRLHGGIAAISGHIGAVVTSGGTLASLGFGVGRWFGVPVYGTGTGHEFKLLLPNFEARLVTDGKVSAGVLGTSITGLRYCSCGKDGGPSVPLKIELRVPTFNLWVPAGLTGRDSSWNVPAVSVGASIDAGFYF